MLRLSGPFCVIIFDMLDFATEITRIRVKCRLNDVGREGED